MKVLLPLVVVAGLFLLGLAGGAVGPHWLLGVALPYAAVAVFVAGLVWRVLGWARSPVPFRIPTTCGQERSLPWIRQNKLDNPGDLKGVLGRMALEILFFRSLLRNTKTKMTADRQLVYGTDLSLWAGAMAMHWALAVVLIRHLRLMTDPVPGFVTFLEKADGFLEIGLPVVFASSVVLLLALLYLLYRRLSRPEVRYISLPEDYFALFLLLGIAGSGFWLRHLSTTDVAGVKELLLGLVHFAPVVPASIHPLFFGHLLLVCVLLVYFPFGKLVHAPGVFLSPTRNL
ncbi:MAG TPA: sulfate reduction electron transfer complex DsrMKJOP subunit DsrM, partial [Longimicrobiales bacterium]|nr:sulfate reduction electron transfer complex DsrMKJOP subunit DsrM [Longimicrobiales bacterium]